MTMTEMDELLKIFKSEEEQLTVNSNKDLNTVNSNKDITNTVNSNTVKEEFRELEIKNRAPKRAAQYGFTFDLNKIKAPKPAKK